MILKISDDYYPHWGWVFFSVLCVLCAKPIGLISGKICAPAMETVLCFSALQILHFG